MSFLPFPRMDSKVVKLTKGNFRSYAAVAMCLKNNKERAYFFSSDLYLGKFLTVQKGWQQYEWTDPAGTQYPSRTNNTHNECVFVQKGNIIFTGTYSVAHSF